MRKFFCLLLILLMLISVSSCIPVYAEDYESYTLEPGKIYSFKKVSGESLAAELSDHVLYSKYAILDYNNKSPYIYGNYINNSKSWTHVYNTNNQSVTMTITGGTITEFRVNESPFSLVMYDGTETGLQIINNIDNYIFCKRYEYNESDHSFDASGEYFTIQPLDSTTLTGRGFLFFTTNSNPTFEGVYEVSNYIRSGFFYLPPWILRMDLAGMIRVLLDQLSTLLPVGLLVLSVFLAISLLLYTMRLFL